jgi:hypothetical protein
MTVRASELATFVFCERAWHYARTGVPYEHPAQLERGTEWHQGIARRSRRSIMLLRLGAILLACGTILLLGISIP